MALFPPSRFWRLLTLCFSFIAMALMFASCATVTRYADPFTHMENKERITPYSLRQKGLIESPYALKVGYVDIRGFQPGELVQCPYTYKVFRVPPEDQFVGIAVDD